MKGGGGGSSGVLLSPVPGGFVLSFLLCLVPLGGRVCAFAPLCEFVGRWSSGAVVYAHFFAVLFRGLYATLLVSHFHFEVVTHI